MLFGKRLRIEKIAVYTLDARTIMSHFFKRLETLTELDLLVNVYQEKITSDNAVVFFIR
jgi:hypothetical protein